jgi:hypothetical protein
MTEPAARAVSAKTTPIPCVPSSNLTTTGGPADNGMGQVKPDAALVGHDLGGYLAWTAATSRA